MEKNIVVGAFVVMDVDISAISEETIKFLRSNTEWIDYDNDFDEDICLAQELEMQSGFMSLSDDAKEEVIDINFEASRIAASYVRLVRY
jgi:hypothetical protein